MEHAYLKCGIVSIKDGDKAAVIQLSTGILEVRAKAARYFDQRTPYRVLLNIIKADDWNRPSTRIEKRDAPCREPQRNHGSLDRQGGMIVMMRPLREQDCRPETLITRPKAPDLAHQDVVEAAYVSRA